MKPRPDPTQIEVKGQGLISVVAAMSLIQSHAQNLLAAHGLNPIEPDKWYPMHKVLEAFKVIGERIGPSTMKSISRKVPDYMYLPPSLQTLEQVLSSLDESYRLGHRGKGHIGSYIYESTGSRSGLLTSDSPYPCEMDMGLLETLCERYKPKGSLWVRVAHGAAGCRTKNGASCTYELFW
ncbi:MAG TPA: hypothetical protein VK539_05925 [Myxococcaceae bacterium]|nr:hypothetical protein [Myxococcaceae bacterium]